MFSKFTKINQKFAKENFCKSDAIEVYFQFPRDYEIPIGLEGYYTKDIRKSDPNIYPCEEWNGDFEGVFIKVPRLFFDDDFDYNDWYDKFKKFIIDFNEKKLIIKLHLMWRI